MKMKIKILVPLVSISSALAFCVYGSAFQVNENSSFLQGMAMAGSGSSPDDVSSIFNNPAALGFLNKSELYIGSSYVFTHVDMSSAKAFHGSLPDPDNMDPVNGSSSQNNIVKNSPIPEIYAAWKLSDILISGISVTTPWGMTSEYNNNSIVRFMAQKTSLKSVNISPMIALKVTKALSISAGLQVQYLNSEFSNYNGSVFGQGDHPTSLDMRGWGVGYLLGAMYRPFNSTYVGLSYRSKIKTHLSGDGVMYVEPGPIAPPLDPSLPYNSYTSASTDFNTPAVLNFSITQLLTKKWSIHSTIQYTFWNTFKKMVISTPEGYAKKTTINYDWHNSWFVALGANYRLLPSLSIKSGISFDQTPTSNSFRDVRIPDSSRLALAFGVSYDLLENFRLDASYEHMFVINAGIHTTQHIGDGKEKNTVSASYSGSADIISLGISYKF